MIGGVALLERAIAYTQGSLQLVTVQDLSRATPCAEWNLRELLDHLRESMVALREAADVGCVDPPSASSGSSGSVGELVGGLRQGAGALLGAWTLAEGRESVAVGGCAIESSLLTGVGAVEVAVHGWDVARACGRSLPIPPGLARELLALAPYVVSPMDRPVRFAVPLEPVTTGDPYEELMAFLGRRTDN